MRTVTVTLPGGLWRDGICHRDAELRPLTGEDEAFLVWGAESLLPAHRTTALLARCLTRVGPIEPVTSDVARSLTVGDREALLLHLRRATFGERLQCIVRCPQSGCDAKLDLTLTVADLLLPPYADSRERYEVEFPSGVTPHRVRLRVPTGADTEAAAALAVTDAARAEAEILRRVVEATDGASWSESIPPTIARLLSDRLSELDPQAEVRLDVVCPDCGSSFSALFDAAAFFHREIAAQTHQLLREVHLLAFHYHWSESEIMAMSPGKRRRYLRLLSEAITPS